MVALTTYLLQERMYSITLLYAVYKHIYITIWHIKGTLSIM